MHFALSLLETSRGRDTLARAAAEIWRNTDRADKRDALYRGTEDDTRQYVDEFLAHCRRDPPNFTVSDRIPGDGMTIRVSWPGRLGEDTRYYNAKWAAVFRINKQASHPRRTPYGSRPLANTVTACRRR